MRARHIIVMLFLSLSWLLSFHENHLCSDASSVDVSLANPTSDHFEVLRGESSSTSTEHDKEMCHFGHCSHGAGLSRLPLTHPTLQASERILIPYPETSSSGITRPNLRPPAIA
ncbi:MAG: hypothetical protein EOP10_09180 [Proteobacteria bacterium]|nr:MAG: hypothetical protein EOP10_09180 [Pseudomonadota bacterium]